MPVDWSPERGYKKPLPKKFFPRTAAGTGESLGLSVTLDVESDNYYCSSSNSIGFKILLHNPVEKPELREIGLLLSAGRETKVRITAEKTISDAELRSMHKDRRKCLFQSEGTLGRFAHYTQRNCMAECGADLLRKLCGCISYFMPRKSENDTICSIYEQSCVERTRLRLMLADYKGLGCDDECVPSCFDLTFKPDFFTTPISHSGFLIDNDVVMNLSHEYVQRNIAIVHIYFKDNSYRSSIQTEFIGLTDVLCK